MRYGVKQPAPAVTRRKDIGHSTNIFPAGKTKCRNQLERIVRVSSAQVRGKRSCFVEYQPHIDLVITNSPMIEVFFREKIDLTTRI